MVKVRANAPGRYKTGPVCLPAGCQSYPDWEEYTQVEHDWEEHHND